MLKKIHERLAKRDPARMTMSDLFLGRWYMVYAGGHGSALRPNGPLMRKSDAAHRSDRWVRSACTIGGEARVKNVLTDRFVHPSHNSSRLHKLLSRIVLRRNGAELSVGDLLSRRWYIVHRGSSQLHPWSQILLKKRHACHEALQWVNGYGDADFRAKVQNVLTGRFVRSYQK